MCVYNDWEGMVVATRIVMHKGGCVRFQKHSENEFTEFDWITFKT